MSRRESGTAVGERVVEAVADGYRASGDDCRVVRHGTDTYIRVQGAGRDGLVWVRDGVHESDAGLSRFVIECDRYGVTDRRVVSVDPDDPVAGHAASLGIEFVGPAALAASLRSVDVPVPFETDESTADDESGGETGTGDTRWRRRYRLGAVLLSALAVTLVLGAAVLVP